MARARQIAGIGLALLVLGGLLAVTGGAPAQARRPAYPSAAEPCSAYPAPGSIAPPGTRIPAWLVRRYSVLGAPRRAIDRLSRSVLSGQLTAADIDLAGVRFLGDGAFGAKLYLVPAEHLLSFSLAPARCLPPGERSLQQELLPTLKQQYPHWALCLLLVGSNGGSPTCGAADRDPEALLYSSGSPGFGLVPDGVPNVTVSYYGAPPRTLAVAHNVFIINAPSQSAAPCAARWLDASGTVVKTIQGCNYGQYLTPQFALYITYVHTRLLTLKAQLSQLTDAIAAGELGAAERDWLTAHLTWLDIGQDDGAYGAFGPIGGAVDGTAAGNPGGTASPGFVGFHRVELDLFTDDDLAAAAADTATLQADVNGIIAMPAATYFPDTPNGIAAWILRPHEVIEDAIRDTLTGDDDYGSGTGVASLTADVSAVRELLSLISPVLNPLAPRLISHAEAELHALMVTAEATKVDGRWVGIDNLPTVEREALDADAGAAAETLSAVPGLLTSIGHAAPTD